MTLWSTFSLESRSRSERLFRSLWSRQELTLGARSFWTDFAPWAPYVSPITDTYDQLRQRSPLLLFCILAVTSRFQEDARFSTYCEERALECMRGTLYTPDPPTLDDLKGFVGMSLFRRPMLTISFAERWCSTPGCRGERRRGTR